MTDLLQKIRPRRSVLERSRPLPELPTCVFYLEWLAGEGKRRVIDTEGNEHLLKDGVVQSYYRLAKTSKAEALISKHWASLTIKPAS